MNHPTTRIALCVATLLVTPECGRAPEPRPNLLLMSVDTLRADRLGAYGYARPTSPRIDEFMREAVVFEDAQVHASWTIPSLASWMTSTYPSTHGAERFDSRLAPGATTLGEMLRDAGYSTSGVFAQVFFEPKRGLIQGVGDVTDVLEHTNTAAGRAISSVTSDDIAIAAASRIEALARDGSPWFLWLHFLDPHAAYVEHAGISATFGTRTPSDRYDGEIRYTDHYVGAVLDALRHYGADSRTVVVLLSDHGEEFEDHGGASHGHTLYDEQLRVPFAIRVPATAPRRVPDLVRAVDLVPTCLELLGLPARPSESIEGRSLVPLLRGESLPPTSSFAEIRHLADADSLTSDRYKLIVEFANGKPMGPRLYDRVVDPHEKEDVSAAHPELTAKMFSALQATRRAARDRRQHDDNALELSGHELEAMRQFGYLK